MFVCLEKSGNLHGHNILPFKIDDEAMSNYALSLRGYVDRSELVEGQNMSPTKSWRLAFNASILLPPLPPPVYKSSVK